jgi:hypothetical protein
MAIVDSQGRLFGKISILDVGAILIILLVVVGIVYYPGTSSVAQIAGDTRPVEVDVIAKGLSVLKPDELKQELETSKKVGFVIRNQPSGQVDVKAVEILPRSVAVPQPDGSVKALPDPRPELAYSTDMLVTLSSNATITPDGPVLGGQKVKVGSLVQLQGMTYDFNASVVDVRIQEKK